MMMKSSTYKAPTIYFSGPRDLEICANIPDPLGTAKGSGDCKNVGADRATQIAPTCANHFVSPQRVWGRDDIVRTPEFYPDPITSSCKGWCTKLLTPGETPLSLWEPHTKSLITSPVFVQMTCHENGRYIQVQSIQNHVGYNFPTPVGDGGGSQSCHFGNSVGIEIRCGG